jgi:hypothetical protein
VREAKVEALMHDAAPALSAPAPHPSNRPPIRHPGEGRDPASPSVITINHGKASERQCAIVPGEKLGLIASETGNDGLSGLVLVVDRIAEGLASGQLRVKDYSCVKAMHVL